MLYIYTSDNCPKCEKQKKTWKENNVIFEERDASRIRQIQDEIDKEALVQASIQNMVLPVIVEM